MSLDPIRRAVLIDMAFELGRSGLAGFPHFLAAMRQGQWATAAVELKNSLLFSQVPQREQENIACLVTGQFPAGVTCAEDLVKRHEGLTQVAKPDAKGFWVLGWGHDIPAPTDGVPPICTYEQAETWFEQDMAFAAAHAEIDLGTEYW
jgi:GH24 family phage-related lysozyme (muramidase)